MVEIILSAAKSVGLSGYFLLSICTVESNLKNAYVENDGGSPSFGICQIKEGTAKMMGFKGDKKELMDPKVNAFYAAKYFKWQKERYNGDLCRAIASYNAGSFLESERRPGYPKNYKYVKKVKENLNEEKRQKIKCGVKSE